MFTLLHIRYLQVKRDLSEAGPGIFLIAAIVAALSYEAFLHYQKTPDAYTLTAVLLLVCVGLQSKRKDKTFVYKNIRHPHWEMVSEYVVLTLPFGFPALFTTNYLCYPALLLALAFVPLLRYSLPHKTYFKHISMFIPATHFEWISGFRKSFLYVIPLYSIALGFCWFRIFPLVALWLITVIIASFYKECEPVHVLKATAADAGTLLKQKLWQASKLLLLLYFPLVLINTFFNPEYGLVNVLFLASQAALVCFAICLKYANYQPSQNTVANTAMLSLVSLGAALPFLLPLPLLLCLDYYGRAKRNLNLYLND